MYESVQIELHNVAIAAYLTPHIAAPTLLNEHFDRFALLRAGAKTGMCAIAHSPDLHWIQPTSRCINAPLTRHFGKHCSEVRQNVCFLRHLRGVNSQKNQNEKDARPSETRNNVSIQWSDSYKIGNAEIDAQHEELFRRANQFLEATGKPALVAFAISLYKYTRSHFAQEEQLMIEIQYPDYQIHKQQHEALILKLDALTRNITDDALNKAEFAEFIGYWLLKHIASTDTKLAAHINQS